MIEGTQQIKRGDIWMAELDGIGCEQKGTRPFVIIQNDVGNKYSRTVIGASMTAEDKKYIPTHVEDVMLRCPSTILCEQIRTIDKCRLLGKIGELATERVDELNEKLMVSLGIPVNLAEKMNHVEEERLLN